jgi:hypothetical protein
VFLTGWLVHGPRASDVSEKGCRVVFLVGDQLTCGGQATSHVLKDNVFSDSLPNAAVSWARRWYKLVETILPVASFVPAVVVVKPMDDREHLMPVRPTTSRCYF